MGKKFGFSFSWKRAMGISAAKQKISRKTGVPLTRQGRQRKMGRMIGYALPILSILFIALTVLLAGCGGRQPRRGSY